MYMYMLHEDYLKYVNKKYFFKKKENNYIEREGDHAEFAAAVIGQDYLKYVNKKYFFKKKLR